MTPVTYQRMALSPDNDQLIPLSEPETGWIAGPIEGAWAKKWVYPVMFCAPFILFSGWLYYGYSNLQREIEDLRSSSGAKVVETTIQSEPSPLSGNEGVIYEFLLPE